MARNAARPLSPHLTIWRWGPHMLVSIMHRIMGNAMAFAAVPIFVWWLAAAASGPAAYAKFTDVFTYRTGSLNIVGLVFFVGLTWAFFQHASSGVRHFVLDTGAGYELKVNKSWATVVAAAPLVLTVLVWAAYFASRA